MSETSLELLLAAVSNHLREEVLPLLEGFDAFGVRVAANAVGIAQREIEARSAIADIEADLQQFAVPADDESTAQALARALRDHRVEVSPALMALLRKRTLTRIEIDNPRYSGLVEARRRWGPDVKRGQQL